MSNELEIALNNPLWKEHQIGNFYSLINRNGSKDEGWKIAYYPVLEDGKTNKPYPEPRVLIEKEIKDGIDFREVPIIFLTQSN